MQITINGELRTLPEALTVEELLCALGYDRRRIAVELNREVVPRQDHPRRRLAAGDALEVGDLVALGELVDRSQRGAELLLGNQVPETFHLARSARSLGAAAASAFGAGFGGSVWALVKRSEGQHFADCWLDSYAASFPEQATRATFFLTGAGPAAMRL